MIVTPGEDTSYSIVISPPNVDRSFLHCPGANDTFCSEDVDFEAMSGARLFHFGYPPLMKRFYEDGGRQMACLLQQVQRQGVLTSLDMAMPDPNSPAGRIDWQAWLKHVLPSVDVFLPSIDEIMLMLRRKDFDELFNPEDGITAHVDSSLLNELAEQLLEMGTQVVVFKLGDQGIYLRTAKPTTLSDGWQNRELAAPCFEVDVAGTTGAGDSTIAGFLAAMVDNASPEEAVVQAVGVGACSVEVTDATSGIRPMAEVKQRIADGWNRRPLSLGLTDGNRSETPGYWIGPRDCAHGAE